MKKYLKTLAVILALTVLLALPFTMGGCTLTNDGGADTANAAAGPITHCLCGANDGEAHIGTCTGEKVQWEPWTGKMLPLESGYYYAAHDSDVVALEPTRYAMHPSFAAKHIVVDLNGKTLAGYGSMMIVLDSVMTLTITDASEGHTGVVKADQKLPKGLPHGLFVMADDNPTDIATLNIYRATVDASVLEHGEFSGGAISVAETNVLNMYNATVKGSNGYHSGGAIYSRGIANLYDSVVYGGELTYDEEKGDGLGGAISSGGTLKMVDCTIYGSYTFRGGAININGGEAVMEGGTIYGADTAKSAGAVNLKAEYEGGARFVMKSSDKGEPVIDASGTTTGGFGGAINVDGFNYLSEFVMESGQIIGGTVSSGTGGGAVLVQDTGKGGAEYRGVFTMNGGTITGGIANGNGGNIRVVTGGVFEMNGGTVTAGQDQGSNIGGVYVEGKLILSGEATITGNEGVDVCVASGKMITVGADWAGNGETALSVTMKDGAGAFAAGNEGATLTEDHIAFFSAEEGTISLVDNTLEIAAQE